MKKISTARTASMMIVNGSNVMRGKYLPECGARTKSTVLRAKLQGL